MSVSFDFSVSILKSVNIKQCICLDSTSKKIIFLKILQVWFCCYIWNHCIVIRMCQSGLGSLSIAGLGWIWGRFRCCTLLCHSAQQAGNYLSWSNTSFPSLYFLSPSLSSTVLLLLGMASKHSFNYHIRHLAKTFGTSAGNNEQIGVKAF